MSSFPAKTDVLIVGAGPTGLALATSLAQAGVDHVLIDKLAAGQHTSRAAVIHAHTLEALETLGVADRLSDTGTQAFAFLAPGSRPDARATQLRCAAIEIFLFADDASGYDGARACRAP